MPVLLILINQPDESHTSDAIIPNICPNLGMYGEQATITATERLRDMVGRKDALTTTLLRVALAGTARIELPQLIKNMERSLTKAAQQAGIAVSFEIFYVEQPVDQNPPAANH
jgi:hypothetical protein